MTRYTVVWDPEVESPFIEAWVDGDAGRRATLREIADWVDANLAVEPEGKGQPDPDSARIVAVPVSNRSVRASVAYRVSTEDRLVRVVRLTIRGW